MTPDLCEHLDDYLLNDLSPERTSAFRRHLADCDACRLAVEQQARLDGLLKAGTEAVGCPPELAPRIRREHGRRLRSRRAVLGNALAAGLVLGFLGWSLVPRMGKPAPENKIAQEPAEPQKTTVPGDSKANPPKLSQADPVSSVRVEFSEDVLAVPIDTGDPDITLIQVFPISNVNADSN